MISETVIDQALRELFSTIQFQGKPEGLYDPLRYMVSIGGKRLRPKLCLTTYGIYSEALTEEILQPAAGLEVFHTFTLIHDDIMDRSPLRRGHETVWKKWGEDTAILSGDVMCIDAYKRIAKAPASVLPQALELFSKTASEVCDGQQWDMEFESVPMVPMQEYMKMVGLKTGVLLAASAAMGALIGGASQEDLQHLYDYGYYLGLAFQVADDYLDAYGDEKVFGKPIGGDILNGKKSWLTIRAYEKGVTEVAEALTAPMADKNAKIQKVMALYEAAGVAADARSAIRELSEKAIDAASAARLSPESLTALKDFAQRLIGRSV